MAPLKLIQSHTPPQYIPALTYRYIHHTHKCPSPHKLSHTHMHTHAHAHTHAHTQTNRAPENINAALTKLKREKICKEEQ